MLAFAHSRATRTKWVNKKKVCTMHNAQFDSIQFANESRWRQRWWLLLLLLLPFAYGCELFQNCVPTHLHHSAITVRNNMRTIIFWWINLHILIQLDARGDIHDANYRVYFGSVVRSVVSFDYATSFCFSYSSVAYIACDKCQLTYLVASICKKKKKKKEDNIRE